MWGFDRIKKMKKNPQVRNFFFEKSYPQLTPPLKNSIIFISQQISLRKIKKFQDFSRAGLTFLKK